MRKWHLQNSVIYNNKKNSLITDLGKLPQTLPSRGNINICVLPKHIMIYANINIEQYTSMFISSSRFFNQEADC